MYITYDENYSYETLLWKHPLGLGEKNLPVNQKVRPMRFREVKSKLRFQSQIQYLD